MWPIISLASLGIGLGYYYDKNYYNGPCKNKNCNDIKNNENEGLKTGPIQLGGDWEMINAINGKTISSNSLQGKFYLLYFGFCSCPDVCPNSLTKIAEASKIINTQRENQNLEKVFVSVDPERDSNDKIINFLALFDKSIIGVRGQNSEDQKYKEILKDFRVYATKIEFEEEIIEKQNNKQSKQYKKNYTIDHTDIIYLMGPKNDYIAPLASHLEPHQLAQTISQYITAYNKENQ